MGFFKHDNGLIHMFIEEMILIKYHICIFYTDRMYLTGKTAYVLARSLQFNYYQLESKSVSVDTGEAILTNGCRECLVLWTERRTMQIGSCV